MKMGGVWGQCCKVDTWVMLGAATQVKSFLILVVGACIVTH